MSPSCTESQNQLLGLKKELTAASLKSDLTQNVSNQDPNVSGIKIPRDQNGKLKLKVGHHRKGTSKEIIMSSRKESKTSEQFQNYCQQPIQDSMNKEPHNFMMMN